MAGKRLRREVGSEFSGGRELGEKGKTNWPNFVLVAMEQFLIRLALTCGAGIGWGDGRTMRERLTAGSPGLRTRIAHANWFPLAGSVGPGEGEAALIRCHAPGISLRRDSDL